VGEVEGRYCRLYFVLEDEDKAGQDTVIEASSASTSLIQPLFMLAPGGKERQVC